MKRFLSYIIILSTFIIADEHSPIFLPIESTEDFYSGSSILLEVQVTDESSIEDILLYYRFSKEDPFASVPMDKEMIYVGTIPGDEVRPGRLEYYFFARDEFGNQSTWPEGGESSPEGYPVFEPLFEGGGHGDFSIELLNPIPDKVSEEASIIILSLYDPEESLDLNDIRLFLDNEDVSETIFKSTDMITYVPDRLLGQGSHIIEVKLIDGAGVYLTKKFQFTLMEIDLSLGQKADYREKFKFKGNISYNSDFDEFFGKDRPKNRPIDSHKINISTKFTIGNIKFKSSVLMNTHLIDESARLALVKSQPSNRLKFGFSSPFLDFKHGDFSTEFSELSLKGTRVRGVYSHFKLGPLRTSILWGNTKESIDFTNDENYDPEYGIYSEGETFTDSNGDQEWNPAEDFNDLNDNGEWDEGETFTDSNGDQEWNPAETFTDNPSTVDGTSVSGGEDVSHVNHTKGTAVRKMDAFRTELNFSKFNFGINALRSYDDIEQYDLGYEEIYDQYTFLGNAVFSTDFTLRFNNKKTQLTGETAISIMNDLRGKSIDELAESVEMEEDVLNSTRDLLNSIEDIVGFNINSDLLMGSSEGRGLSIPIPDTDSLETEGYIVDYIVNKVFKQGTYKFTFRTPIEFQENTFDIQAEYKRIPSNFISLGNSSIQADVQGLKSSIKGRLLKNILSVSLGYDNEHDNLMGETLEEKLKSSTSTSATTSGGLGINYPNYPSINYSIREMSREGVSIQDQSIATSNKTITHTISPSYKFDTDSKLNVSLGANIMMMNYNDELYDPADETATNTNFTTGSYTGSLGLRFDFPLSFNLGGGLSINSPEETTAKPTEFIVVTSKLGYKFMEKTLNTFLGLNIVSGSKEGDAEGNGKIDNLKMTIKAGTQYKFTKNMSLGLNVDFISLSDNIAPSNDFSQLKAKLKFKMGF